MSNWQLKFDTIEWEETEQHLATAFILPLTLSHIFCHIKTTNLNVGLKVNLVYEIDEKD